MLFSLTSFLQGKVGEIEHSMPTNPIIMGKLLSELPKCFPSTPRVERQLQDLLDFIDKYWYYGYRML